MTDLDDLTRRIGETNAANGWHDRFNAGWEDAEAAVDWVAAKLALIHSEVSEALEELRNGYAPTESYYTGIAAKPEGFPSELADVIIRTLDLAYVLGIDITAAVEEKASFNATRGHKARRKGAVSMRINKAREVRDLAQDVVRLIDAAVGAAHRDQDARNQCYMDRGLEPLTSQPDIAYNKEASALRRRSLDLTRALAELRRSR